MPQETFRVPGEWENQGAVILAWGGGEVLENLSVQSVHVETLRALVGRVALVVVAASEQELVQARAALEEADVAVDGIRFAAMPEVAFSSYVRDYGPECVVGDRGGVGHVDVNWTTWGILSQTHPVSRQLERCARNLAATLGIPEHGWTRLCGEGGGREFNGKGVLMVVESTELQRNPGMEKEEIEAEYKRIFQLQKVIWLKHPTYEDQHMFLGPVPGSDGSLSAYRSASANGHIDEFCRFVGSNTVLLAEVSEEEANDSLIHSINRTRMQENFQILAAASDQDGKPFDIVRMPMPEPVYLTMSPEDPWYATWTMAKQADGSASLHDGSPWPRSDRIEILPALSYCNFLISNGVVLGQRYWTRGRSERIREKDERAAEVLRGLFPEREVVMIDAMALNVCGGGIHCNSRNIPPLAPGAVEGASRVGSSERERP